MSSTVTKNILTYSAFSTFRSCPRKYKNRYEDHLKSKEKADSLYFGQVIHEALTIFYRSGRNLEPVTDYLQKKLVSPENPDDSQHAFLLACAMMDGYAARYESDEWKIEGLDVEFTGTIRNPATGRESRTFFMAGKANGIVIIDGEWFLLEHRTASCAEEIDTDRLWADTKASLYCYYLRQAGTPVVGVIYNILMKSRIRPKAGETFEDFQKRRDESAARNKSGTTKVQQQMPETPEEFKERLREWYAKPEAFYRVALRIPQSRLALLEAEIWEVTQQYLGSRRRGQWLLNTGSCFHYNQPCEYLKYCRSGFHPGVCRELYEILPPHEELPLLGLQLRPEEQKRYEEIRKDCV